MLIASSARSLRPSLVTTPSTSGNVRTTFSTCVLSATDSLSEIPGSFFV